MQRFIGQLDQNRELKLHVYAKRQMSDSSWEFLKIENEQIETAQIILMNNGKLLIYVWK